MAGLLSAHQTLWELASQYIYRPDNALESPAALNRSTLWETPELKDPFCLRN